MFSHAEYRRLRSKLTLGKNNDHEVAHSTIQPMNNNSRIQFRQHAGTADSHDRTTHQIQFLHY